MNKNHKQSRSTYIVFFVTKIIGKFANWSTKQDIDQETRQTLHITGNVSN